MIQIVLDSGWRDDDELGAFTLQWSEDSLLLLSPFGTVKMLQLPTFISFLAEKCILFKMLMVKTQKL